ncbi:hypothetical protein SmJEL517_g06060 [Synchytrium microbalum]|uniref:TOG domain-containing protein n=1 Tax=Synchytrium microbalum TaxID=1806994 RepID=A0A507BKM7_9FUNG|nr:uncharacterized protein SmJEL517_g06060 [Synchytrium microbalum]TPX30377.1 hypothetical protein SmJEL517_g06060 [Synchytrium microbalum]
MSRRQQPAKQAALGLEEQDEDDDLFFEQNLARQQEEELALPWTEFIEKRLYPAVSISKPRERINIWSQSVAKIKQDEPESLHLQALLEAVFASLPRYSDKESRNAVWQLVITLMSANRFSKTDQAGDPVLLMAITRMLERELKSSSLLWAPSILFAYSAFATKLMAQTPISYSLTTATKILLSQQVNLWQSLVDQPAKKFTLAATRAFRYLLRQNPQRIQPIIEFVCTNMTADSWKYCLLLDPCMRATPVMDKSLADDLLKTFAKAVNTTKSAIPDAYLESFSVFFHKHITAEMIDAELMASAEKLLLRSPEVVLKVYTHVFRHVPINASQWYIKFAESLVKHLQSSNDDVQTAAVDFISILTKKSTDSLHVVADVMIKALNSKVPNPDHRQAIVVALSSLPLSTETSIRVVQHLTSLASKETNEAVVSTILSSRMSHISFIIDNVAATKELLQAILFGMGSDKAVNRQGYLTCLESCLASRTAHVFLGDSSVKLIKEDACKTLEKVSAVGIGILDSSKKEVFTLVEGFLALSWLLQVDKENGLSWLTKAKFALDSRLYLKLDTQMPFVNCVIELCQSHYNSDDSALMTNLSNALVFCLVSTPLFRIRNATTQKVSDLCKNSVEMQIRILHLIGTGAHELLTGSNQSEEISAWNDKPAFCGNELGSLIFRALEAPFQTHSVTNKDVQAPTAQQLEKELADLLVLLCHPVITNVNGTDAWVRLTVKAGLDAMKVVEAHGPELVSSWLSLPIIPSIPAIVLASQIAPTTIFPLIIPYIRSSLAIKVGQNDYDIYQAPPDQLHAEFTSNAPTTPKASSSRSWELERQLMEAKGKKPPPKTAKSVDSKKSSERAQQLEKEAEIRQRVQLDVNSIKKAVILLGAVIEAVSGPLGGDAFEQLELWLSPILDSILSYSSDGDRAPVSKAEVVNAYFRLAETLDLHPLIPSVVAAVVLRTLNVKEGPNGIPIKWCQTEYASALSHMMTMLKKIDRFEPLEFIYVFTLLETVIMQRGRIPTLRDKQINDTIMTCADILLTHASLTTLEHVPRGEMVKCVIHLLTKYPRVHKRGREGLLTMCAAVGESMAAAKEDELETSSPVNGKSPHSRGFRDDVGVVKELVEGLVSEEAAVREACLAALTYVEVPALLEDDFDARVWTLKHDTAAEAVVQEAQSLWEEWNGEDTVKESVITHILDLTVHSTSAIRVAAGLGLRSALDVHTESLTSALEYLYKTYAEKVEILPPEFDDYGMVIPHTLNRPDQWEARFGVALALQAVAPTLNQSTLLEFFAFLISSQALGDRSDIVRKTMLQAGVEAVKGPGKESVKPLLSICDEFLSRPAGQSEEHDRMREAVVILLGTLSQHLDSSDPTIPTVVSKLIETLKTPSEIVQSAVAECLPALVKVIPGNSKDLADSLLKQMFESPKYAERRGAAYGLSGVVKGRGISALKEFGIMQSLKEAVEDKKRMERREGALFAIETLSLTLGRLFEPFIVQILPLLLVCFGDSSQDVRAATEDASRAIMSKLSAHAVKLVLPSLLNGLADRQWRAKCGSIELLGSMAFLAPKQLSLSLPTIIPRLVEVLSDTHSKVQETAKMALTHFGSVIKNPEIQALVPTILQGMVDPNNKTLTALTALLETTFVHYIDAPSLALVIPILRRGLKERSTDVRKKAAQIMGNIASLTEQKDLTPYLPVLMPGLKEVLVDPVPEARSIAAHALGSMVQKLSEDVFPGLVSELLQTLKSDTSAVDRSGAAQGLSEVLAGIGIERMEAMLPEIQLNISSPRPYVREGFMLLFIYLPLTFGEKFRPYLGSMIPALLKGLADDAEPVRDAALRSGQMVIRGYAKSAIDLLLPELERGLFDNNWRIRQSSIQLMGDLLYKVGGGNTNTDSDEEDDEDAADESDTITKSSLVEALGIHRYQTVMSSIYIIRADNIAIVRQASLHVWKSIVVNTPRTLKEIFPVMMSILINCFSSSSTERRGVAARTLGDLVQKMGETVLAQIIPILESGITDADPATRQGVCIGMTEIMAALSKTQGGEFATHIIGPIRKALVDEESEVREAAAQAFDSLHQILGARAIDEVLPSLLNDLKSGGGNTYALEALKEIMAVRSNVVFPVLAPTLMARPITSFNARALGTLITVAGSALNRRLGSIVSVLLDAVEDEDEGAAEAENTLKILLLKITTDDLPTIMTILIEGLREGSASRRQATCKALVVFFAETEADLNDDLNDWIERLIELMTDEDMVENATAALDALLKRIRKDDLDRYVSPVRRAISMACSNLDEGEIVKGFASTKGVSGILSIFLQGLSYGSADIREQSALGLGDVVTRSTPEALKPFVTQMTGPLIRVVGDRVPSGVKSAILYTLGLLLKKVPLHLKPFLPQLQRTFIKALSEPGSNIARDRAANNLSLLIPQQPRLDPLVVELTQGIRAAEDRGVKEAMWQAMYGLVKNLRAGREINESSKSGLQNLLMEAILSESTDDNVRVKASRCLGCFCEYATPAEALNIIGILGSSPALHGVVLSWKSILDECPSLIDSLSLQAQCQRALIEGLGSDKLLIGESAVKATGRFLTRDGSHGSTEGDELVPILASILTAAGKENEVRRESLVVLKKLAKKQHSKSILGNLSVLVPPVMVCVRDRIIFVKLAAERCLLHLFQLSQGENVLQGYLKTLDAANARSVGDYARRVLSKLSQDEESDDDE